MANTAKFDAIRYFLSVPSKSPFRHTKVKDFRKGLAKIPSEDQDFLHQYMTLTKCDLYFADKAILIEGTTERLLIPRICAIVDGELSDEKKLAQQYISTIEVGGAYAGKFYELLDFLELKSLFITDVDAVFDDGTKPTKWRKCPYSQGTRSNNSALRAWFGKEKGDALLLNELEAKAPKDKIQNYRRIAYQIPEEGLTVCGRSYEDAFIIANPKLFPIPEGEHAGDYAWTLAQDMGKTETALLYAIRKKEWLVPLYIKEGLIWLAEPPPPPEAPPALGTEAVAA
ncbi:TOPRIM nucleotidyl transferase/hydrolase domain-containing protein [Shinella sp. SUS2]|uniref:TOPRIM nucleotidyl transferase/hydrolase domain-containing protein n=1 Tax=unclassified Shinella TaxID=2643062 RepID=UPI0035290575